MKIKTVRVAAQITFLRGEVIKAFHTNKGDKITLLDGGLFEIESRGRTFLVHASQCEYAEKDTTPESHQIEFLERESKLKALESQIEQLSLEAPLEAPVAMQMKSRKEPVSKK